MANLFYGVSTTAADTAQKEVVIYNPLQDEIVPGDLLAVYFSDGNIEESPTLIINGISSSNGENEQGALAEDEGVIIKTRNVEEEVDYMWQAGEVCIFALVSQQTNTDIIQSYESPSQSVSSANDALYYMLIRGSRAGSEYYGLTKLFIDDFGQGHAYNSFQDWLADDEASEDKTTAATPFLLKQLSEFLIGKISISSEEEESETQSPFISYISDAAVEDGILIGTLKVGDVEYQVKIPNVFNIYNRTSQFLNDADIVPNQGAYIHNRIIANDPISVGTFFITNVIDNNLYLYKPNSQTGIYIANPVLAGENSNIQSPVEGGMVANELLVREQNESLYTSFNRGFPNDPLYIYGKPIHIYADTLSPIFTFNEDKNISTIPVQATEFFENGVSLKSKYAHNLVIKRVRLGYGPSDKANIGSDTKISYSIYENDTWVKKGSHYPISVDKTSNVRCWHQIQFNEPNSSIKYRPLGVVGYDISYASSTTGYYDGTASKPTYGTSSDPAFVSIWELVVTDVVDNSAVIYCAIRNYKSTAIKVIIDINVLCEQIYE